MATTARLGCIVRSGPYGGRSGRDQLDVIMAAALTGWELELFFIGHGVLHLVPDKQHSDAGLPGTWRGWKGLAELGPVHAWVESRKDIPDTPSGSGPLLSLGEMDTTGMAERLAACDQVMVL